LGCVLRSDFFELVNDARDDLLVREMLRDLLVREVLRDLLSINGVAIQVANLLHKPGAPASIIKK
jgi:hypothetical protein